MSPSIPVWSRSSVPSLALPVLLALFGCGGGDEPQPDAPATPAEAMAQMATALQGAAGETAEPVDPEVLAARMPEEVDGLPRVDVEQMQGGGMGMSVTTVTARYEEGSRRVSVMITDAAGAPGMGVAGMAAWSLMDFDRSDANGYERTTTFQGFRAMESSRRSGGRLTTELSILVGDRFIVQLAGQEVEVEVLEEAARALDLTGLRDAG